MKGVQKVVWSEGLLMAPQHLQQQDRYHEALLCDRLDAMHPFNWGVVKVELDKKLLSAGQVQLAQFRGVLPDGTVLVFDQQHPEELPPIRVIAEHFPHTQATLDIYLGLPIEREGADNYAERAVVRYAADRRHVYDLTGGGTSAEVSFARRRPVLLFGDENRDGVVTMKVAEIVRDDTNSPVISDTFIPPCLRVDTSPFLIAALRRLLNTLVSRHKSLSEARREATKSLVEFGTKDVSRFLLLNTVNQYIPVLGHVVDSGYMSPDRVYTELCELGGQLTTFSTEISPTSFPRFVYTDLRQTFEELVARIISLLRTTVEEHFIAIDLQGRPDGMYVATIGEERWWTCSSHMLVVKTDLPEQPTATQIPRLSKIASWSDINSILSAATPGCAVEVNYRPPPEIPVKSGLVYFTINTDNTYWRNISAEKNVAVYLPPLFDPAKTTVQLMAVLGTAPPKPR
ncbi:MAG TPA: type VI secretion system baseplate subunit TssK [Polyangiales bacterium]|nr:type VI secretion system baseplate subunit TssK [Polyangiales bacterium]